MPCFACESNEQIGALPPREEILVAGSWRVAHAFGTSLPGWLVVVPTRHVTALHDMAPDEAAQLGEVLHRTSAALRDVVGCEKSYVVFFAEAEGFEHLHVHVVPRMPWFTPDQRGPRVFSFLGVSGDEEIPEPDRDALALRLRAALHATRTREEQMDDDEAEVRRTNIGGRYGSPTFTIGLPFSHIVNTDSELRDAVADLALLVARLAAAGHDDAERAVVARAAEELATRLSS